MFRARHIVSCAIFSACDGCHYLTFRVQQGTIPTLSVGTGIVVDEVVAVARHIGMNKGPMTDLVRVDLCWWRRF